ncbi:hypothetical protein PAMP_011732 [Pampus punctatissimus]
MDAEDRGSASDVTSDRCGLIDGHLKTHEGIEAEGPDEKTLKDEEPALPLDFKWLEELYEEELKLFRQNIESLLEQRDNLEKEIERQKAADNSVVVFRLRAQHRSLCQELRSDEEMESHLNAELRQQELELSELEVELGRFSSLRQEVQEEERVFQVFKAQKAVTRLQQERKACQNLQLKMQHLRDKQAAMLKKEEAERQKKNEEGLTNRKIAAKYLRQTIGRIHQQEAEKQQQNMELQEKRIQAVKSLKSNIAATQESLRVQQSKAKANAQKKEQQLKQLRESLQAQGINSMRHMYQQKQLEEIKRKQEEFEERQKSKRMEIVDKILREEQLVKRRTKHQALLAKPSTTDKIQQGRAREKLLYYLDPNPPSTTEDRATIMTLNETMKTMLMQTEVKQQEPAVAGRKLNMPTKKVCGKELKGPPFISKPEVVFFKDFEVGKTYKKKIILTNISYITNHCKLIGVSAPLKDFISINFEPPGSLSTGMSCDMQAVFRPMINEDLEGEVQFTSAVGPFSVPVRCTIKKCNLEVDSQFIDFGSNVVGQTISRTITLTNKGALATLFSLDSSACLSPETNHVQMPSQVSANTCQRTSSHNSISENQKSSESTGELKPDCQELSEASQNEQPVSEASATGPGVIPETCVSSDVDAQLNESSSDSSDISLGNIPIKVRGVAVSLPVWVVQPSIDLKICMFDRLYQDSIMVQSSASTALKLTFDVCPEMRKHVEILPKTGFIQAQSSFNAQLKFLPRRSLSKDAKTFFDTDTRVLEVPMTVQVAGQAVVTSSDLQFDRTEVDFGYCSIYQFIKSSVRLTNTSLLPQDFGFLGVPEFIEVQPNDGFGTLLPQETLEIDLIFSARKAKEYKFQLSCKSGIDRVFLLSCRAVGVRPPLELSHSLVSFGATAVGDQSTAVLYLFNNHADCNASKPPAPRGLREAVAPVAPRLFCFTPPQDSDIRITPPAGRLLAGERCLVQVTFRPRLSDQEIKDEALRLLHRAKLLREELERDRHAEQSPPASIKKEISMETNKGKKATVIPKNSKVSESPKPDRRTEPLNPDSIQPESEQYEEAKASLLYSFTRRYREYTVPCYVSDGDPPEEDQQAQPAWSPFNTLYLKLQCPAVQPPLVVTSNNGHNVIDFYQVAVDICLRDLTVHRCFSLTLSKLRSSVLDIYGPFSLLNALRCIRPGEKHTLILAFSPTLEKKHCETLEVSSRKMVLKMTLCGEGVVPAVTSSHPGGVLDFGYVLEKESTSQVLKLQNSSVVAVRFRVLLSSLAPSRPQGGADKVAFLLGSYTDSQVQPTVGTQNHSGLSVFSVVPVEGSIAPGQSQDITVTFQPDHPSVYYSDRLTVELTNKSKICVIDLKGAASSHLMYLHGGDLLNVPIESLLPPLMSSQPQLTESEVIEKPNIPVLVTLRANYSAGAIKPAVRELQVGCIRSTQPSKKSAEFHFDNVASLQQQGFSVEPSRGSVEPGHRRTITFTWTPHSGYKECSSSKPKLMMLLSSPIGPSPYTLCCPRGRQSVPCLQVTS